MFDQTNKLAMDLVRVSKTNGRQWLAVEIYRALPVKNDTDLYALQSQIFVVSTLLSMQPTYDKSLRTAIEALRKEISVVSQSPKETFT